MELGYNNIQPTTSLEFYSLFSLPDDSRNPSLGSVGDLDHHVEAFPVNLSQDTSIHCWRSGRRVKGTSPRTYDLPVLRESASTRNKVRPNTGVIPVFSALAFIQWRKSRASP
jgi:hypothetical protein